MGLLTGQELAKQGANVVLCDINRDAVEACAEEIRKNGGKAIGAVVDVRNYDDICAARDRALQEFGTIDILHNCAGGASCRVLGAKGAFQDWDVSVIQWGIDVNLKGALMFCHAVISTMIAQKRGVIINMGSIAGTQTYENGAVYCATKHAVHALSEGMRMDLLRHEIKVTEIRPGMVETEFSIVRFHGDKERADKVYEGIKPLTGEDIARIIAWIVSLPEHVNINDIEVMPARQANAFLTYRG